MKYFVWIFLLEFFAVHFIIMGIKNWFGNLVLMEYLEGFSENKTSAGRTSFFITNFSLSRELGFFFLYKFLTSIKGR